MNRRLLEHQPRIEVFDISAAPTAQDGAELQQVAELLEQADNGRAEAHLAHLARQALAPFDPSLAREAGRWLGHAARRLLHGQRSAVEAGRVFGLELEGLSPEDQSFEVARHFSRFATDVLHHAATRQPSGLSPQAVVQWIVQNVARTQAPGLRDLLTAVPPGGLSPARPLSPPFSDAPPGAPATSPKESVMHDIDRTQMEYGSQPTRFDQEQFEFQEAEWAPESGAVLSEADEYELAMELLGVTSEAELDQFLGGLIKKVGRGFRQFASSSLGKAVGGVLKGVAQKALPIAGGALGGFIGGPIGAQIGSGLAKAAGGALGLEAEAMSQEEQEFQGAKQFVRLAADTVNKAMDAASSGDPRAVAQSAAVNAARQLAPGLLKAAASVASAPPVRGQSGRWARQGNKIVLYGA
jgi:hypothetical protein